MNKGFCRVLQKIDLNKILFVDWLICGQIEWNPNVIRSTKGFHSNMISQVIKKIETYRVSGEPLIERHEVMEQSVRTRQNKTGIRVRKCRHETGSADITAR